MKRIIEIGLYMTGIVCLLLSACRGKDRPSTIIAFSQCMGTDLWRQTMLDEMKRELSFRDDIQFLYRDAHSDSREQVRQIHELMAAGANLLIVSPNEVQPLTPVIAEAYHKGIPVVLVDRRTNSADYTAFVGAENREVGENAGRYAVNLLKKQGAVLEVTAEPDASPFIGRHRGFANILQSYPQIRSLGSVDGRNKSAIDSAIRTRRPDLVFAYNDMMAADVWHAAREANIPVHIIGVDGLPMAGMGLDMVASGILDATVLYPTGGKEAIQTSLAILDKKPYKKDDQLFTTVIDSANVRLMKMQAEKLASQQQEIRQTQTVLDRQRIVSRNQSVVIMIIAATLSLALIFGGLSYYFLKENNKINHRLEIQNRELETMSAQAEKSHQDRLDFFTNISHEFRTPLTLILAPLEDLQAHPRVTPAMRQILQLVQRNVRRLYKLVDQLMDFRKIEFRKMQLDATQNELVAFMREILTAYQPLARQRDIQLLFSSPVQQLPWVFDTAMLEKVLFNLLSNAFKFTPDNGWITLSLAHQTGRVQIAVEDNGAGMSHETLQHIFEPFFQAGQGAQRGTGLGLALSRELINLHEGTIRVSSRLHEGTRFDIELPAIPAQTGPAQETDPATYTPSAPELYLADLQPSQPLLYDPAINGERPERRYTILVVEDHPDLRAYLQQKLSAQYDVIAADNGEQAWQLCLETAPDLVISDVVMPGKDGIQLSVTLKQDRRTSHIPVILLTARGAESQRAAGIQAGADLYITKPFDYALLEQQLQNILTRRDKTREYYSSDQLPGIRDAVTSKADRKLLQEFQGYIDQHLGDENMNIGDICRALAISHVQLARKIKALTDNTINECIIQARIQKARYYLLHEDLSINEIAYRTGFASAAYFSTTFKAKMQLTPSEYRLQRPAPTNFVSSSPPPHD